MLQWGFRRCEDICWVKTNKSNATPGLRHDSHTLFQHSKVLKIATMDVFYFNLAFRLVLLNNLLFAKLFVYLSLW